MGFALATAKRQLPERPGSDVSKRTDGKLSCTMCERGCCPALQSYPKDTLSYSSCWEWWKGR